jgi:hypothetical protein
MPEASPVLTPTSCPGHFDHSSRSAIGSTDASRKPRGDVGRLLPAHGKQGRPWDASIRAPPRALAIVSAVIAGLAAGMSRALGGSHFDRGKAFDPRTQVIGEHKRAATALDRAQFARLDRLVERRPTAACDDARFHGRQGVYSSSSRHQEPGGSRRPCPQKGPRYYLNGVSRRISPQARLDYQREREAAASAETAALAAATGEDQ